MIQTNKLGPNKLCLFSVFLTLSVVYLSIALKSEARAITNKMRYAKSDEKHVSSSIPLEQVFELTAARSDHHHQMSSPSQNKYIIHRRDRQQQGGRAGNFNYKSLDDEDRRLLEKFHRETKSSDPFLGDSLTTEALWDEQEVGGLDALLDGDPKLVQSKIGHGDLQQLAIDPAASKDWTHEPEYLFESKKLVPDDGKSLTPNSGQASYSPPLHLLTSYNPVAFSLKSSNVYQSNPKENRLVGATLYGQDKDSKPGVSSKSALEAVKLHDNLLKTPPRDGVVRVRMYYHRAIHDDKRLYGTGPWKYWGHGWGLEFGYDPKSEKKNKDFYQKGYTIERAFGRDFCRDKNNCRQSDPDFFKDPKNVGKYSEQHAAKLMEKPKYEPQRNSREYRRV